jgi:hypothetical protein
MQIWIKDTSEIKGRYYSGVDNCKVHRLFLTTHFISHAQVRCVKVNDFKSIELNSAKDPNASQMQD